MSSIYSNVYGHLVCIRCGQVSHTGIQTHLFAYTRELDAGVYAGTRVAIDDLPRYEPLVPWDRGKRLNVVMGDWECDHCGLAWQWAIVLLVIEDVASPKPNAILEKVQTFVPDCPEGFMDVHFVEQELIYRGRDESSKNESSQLSPMQYLKWFASLPLEQRVSLIIEQYKRFLKEMGL